MADVDKAKRNVRRMIDGGASESEIDTYLGSQGLSAADLRAKPKRSGFLENLAGPAIESVQNVAQKYGAMAQEDTQRAADMKRRAGQVGGVRALVEQVAKGQKNKGPGIGDFGAVALSPIAGAYRAITRPAAEATVDALGPIEERKFFRNPFEAPRMLSREESARALEGDLTTALSAGMPARGMVGAAGPQVPQRGYRLPVAPAAPVQRPQRDEAIDSLMRGLDPVALQTRAAELRAAGIDPRLIDVLPDQGLGRVRAAATRQTPGRDQMVAAAEQARINLPERVGVQVRRNVSGTPTQLQATIDQLRAQRGAQAATDYGPAYATRINIPPEVSQAVRSNTGRQAINDALLVARENMGTPADEIADLERLLQAAQGAEGPLPAVSARVLDRVQIAMRQAAENAAGYGPGANRPLASAIRGRRDVINQALDVVPDLAPARQAYRQASSVIDATEAAPGAITAGGAEDIANLTQGLTPQQLQPARDVLAQSMIERGGESLSSARNLLERAAFSPEMQGRVASYTGPQSAQGLATGARLELERLKNLQRASPRIGSETATNASDIAEGAGAVVETLRKGAKGDVIGLGIDYLRSRGINDQQAQRIIETVLDPNGLAQTVAYIRARQGPSAAIQFLRERQQLIQSVPMLQITAQGGSGANLPQLVSGVAAQEEQPQ
jgi:hypothetical protein